MGTHISRGTIDLPTFRSPSRVGWRAESTTRFGLTHAPRLDSKSSRSISTSGHPSRWPACKTGVTGSPIYTGSSTSSLGMSLRSSASPPSHRLPTCLLKAEPDLLTPPSCLHLAFGSYSKIESFIRSKYESKRWAMDGPRPDPRTLNGGTPAAVGVGVGASSSFSL